MKVPVFVLLFLLFVQLCNAQADSVPRIDATFNNTRAVEVIRELERQSGYFFYYDTAQIDSFFVNTIISNKLLEEALSLAFKNTGIYYALDSTRTAYITVNRPLVVNVFSNNQKVDTAVAAKPDSGKPGSIAAAKDKQNTLYRIGTSTAKEDSRQVTLAGYVRDAKTGEPISGASLQVETKKIQVLTDQYGFYSLSLPRGNYVLHIQSLGMDDARKEVVIEGSGNLDIEMAGRITTLKHVVISSLKASSIKSPQMGIQQIDIKTIKQVPVVFGEADVLRVVMSTPGVKTIGEASTGLNVRGGSVDQNLILFNDATIYNPSHFFGLFSAFNPEVIKDVTLYKSNVPSPYGGRLSSVLEITSREGNKKNLTGSAGIGLLTSRMNVEGPIVKDKASFIVGGRTTYANWMLNLLPDEYKNSRAHFNDINVNFNYTLNKNNSLYLTLYNSSDRFRLNSDTIYKYGNQNVSLKWKHTFNNKLNLVLSTGLDKYKYDISSGKDPLAAYELKFQINQAYVRAQFNYYPGSNHVISFGVNSLRYKISPGIFTATGGESLIIPKTLQNEQALESAVYLGEKLTLSPSITLEGGVRYSMFNYLGPVSVNKYAPGLPVTTSTFTHAVGYGKGKFVQNYAYPEFKFAAAFLLNENNSVKASFNTAYQYIHLLTNTMAVTPTDVWKLSDPNIKPQKGNQYSLGLYRNLKANTIQASLEVYYKTMHNYLDYKSGASLLLNTQIETDVFTTRGKSYGAEFLVRKTTGKLNGWISYTWSRILLKQSDTTVGEVINNGAYYPANYDKPHDVTAVSNYRINHRFSVSLNATYSTGRPITVPIGRYFYSGSFRTLFADRNSHRIPDYFRTDISMNIEGNHKVKQKFHNSWTIGIYNLTGRNNPYSVYYQSENGSINGYKLSIFGSMIPFINYNIRF